MHERPILHTPYSILLILCLLFLASCSKDDVNQEVKSVNDIHTRSESVDSTWVTPDDEVLGQVFADMLKKDSIWNISRFIEEYGFIKFDQAREVIRYDEDNQYISIPTVKNDTFNSIIFVHYNQSSFHYFHIELKELRKSADFLIEKYGIETVIHSILESIKYDRRNHIYEHKFLRTLLNDARIKEGISEIEIRGWCLIEVILWNDVYDADLSVEVNNRLYYNKITEVTIFSPPKDKHPREFDPTWNSQNEWYEEKGRSSWRITGDFAIIHGQSANGGEYEIFHFWGWCPEHDDQLYGNLNWTYNIEGDGSGGPGGSGDVGGGWSYTGDRWYEVGSGKCIFAVNNPHAMRDFELLEEALLSETCGDAATYVIKKAIDDKLIELCEDYYSEQGGTVPMGPGYDLEDAMEEVETTVSTNNYVLIGNAICELCELQDTESESSCIEAFDNCPIEHYDACVADRFCEIKLDVLESKYDISLSSEVRSEISAQVDCIAEGFEEAAMFAYLSSKLDLDDNEVCLKSNLHELQKINTFLTQHEGGHGGSDCENSEENLSYAVANAYADAMCNEGITQLDLGDIGNSSDPLWGIIKEQLWEMSKELLADVVPGGTLALLGPELFDNLDSGNWMDGMYNALEIVLNEADVCFPAAKIASLGLGLYTNSKHLSKFYDAFNKAKNLGDDVVDKLYTVLKSKLGDDIFKKFKWVNNTTGAEITDVGDPNSFWGEFKDLFSDIEGPFPNPTQPLEQTYRVLSGTIEIKFYPESFTTGGYTLSIRKRPNGTPFKIRFS